MRRYEDVAGREMFRPVLLPHEAGETHGVAKSGSGDHAAGFLRLGAAADHQQAHRVAMLGMVGEEPHEGPRERDGAMPRLKRRDESQHDPAIEAVPSPDGAAVYGW